MTTRMRKQTSTTATRTEPTDPAEPPAPRPSSTAAAEPPRPSVPRPRGRAKAIHRQPGFLQTWGPLIVVVAVIAAAFGALAFNPGAIPGRTPAKPTPIEITDGQIIPPVPPTPRVPEVMQTAVAGQPIPTAEVASVRAAPTAAAFMAPVTTNRPDGQYPAPPPVPTGALKLPDLPMPDSSARLASEPDAVSLMNQSRQAIAALTSMREEIYGRYVEPRTADTVMVERYTLRYKAPNARLREGTVGTRFENGVDTKPVRDMDIANEWFKQRPDGSWERGLQRPGTSYSFPSPNAVFGSAFNARVVGDDVIDGKAYKVVEYDQLGTDEVGSPGYRYRNRIWLDANTFLPFKMEKTSFINRTATGGQETTNQQFFFGIYLYDDFNAPVEIQTPTNIANPMPSPTTPNR